MQSSMLRHITEDFGNGGTIDGTLVVTGDLQVDGGGTLSFNEIIEGTSVIDVDSTTALVVRKNGASGDVFKVDTQNTRVGIGSTFSPSYLLHLKSGDNVMASFESTDANASIYLVDSNTTADATFKRVTNDLILLESGGNVGIGGSPTSKLFISESTATTGEDGLVVEKAQDANQYALRVKHDSASSNRYIAGFQNSSGNVLLINSAGDSTFSGNVKILDTSAPNIRLNPDASDATDADRAFIGYATGNDNFITGTVDNDLAIRSSATGNIVFGRGTTESARLDSSGNATFAGDILVNNATPALTLQDSDGSNQTLEILHSGANTFFTSRNGSSNGAFFFRGYNGSSYSTALTIDSSQNSTFAGSITAQDALFLTASDNVAKFESSDAIARIVIEDNASENNGNWIAVQNDVMSFATNGSNTALTLSDNQNATFTGDVISDGNLKLRSGSGRNIYFTEADGTTDEMSIGYDQSEQRLIFRSNAHSANRMVIKKLGSIGIGIDNPSNPVHIRNSDNQPLRVESTDVYSGIEIKDSGSSTNPPLISTSSDDFIFYGGNASTRPTILTLTSSDQSATFSGDVTIDSGTRLTSEGTNQRLKIHGSGDNYILTGCYEDNGWGYFNSYNNANGIQFFTNAGSFYFNNANVGIGVTPTKRLELGGGTSGQTLLFSNTGVNVTDGARVQANIRYKTGSYAGQNTIQILTETAYDDSSAVVFNTGGGSTERLRITSQGLIGIGINNPNTLLEVSGTSAIRSTYTGTSSAGVGGALQLVQDDGSAIESGHRIGYVVFGASEDSSNTIHFGGAINAFATETYSASGNGTKLTFDVTANSATSRSTALTLDENSRISLSNNDSGSNNTVFGYKAGNAIASGTEGNVLIGHNTGLVLNGGDENVAIGADALKAGTTGVGNTVVGTSAGDAVTSQSNLTLVGKNAGGAINDDGADGTTAVGISSLGSLTSGADNVAIGMNAMFKVNTGHDNVAVGKSAGFYATTAGFNTFIGKESAQGINATKLTGDNNVAVGYRAGYLLQGSSASNVIVGSLAGDAITTGTSNVIVGQNSDISAVDGTNQIVIGQGVTGQADNSVTLGNSSVSKIYVAPGNATEQSIVFKDTAEQGQIVYSHSNEQFQFKVGGNSIKARIRSGGDLYLDGGQITFPASQNASSDANTLDDYEEGAWTPVIKDTSDNAMTMDGNTSGRYVKIGSQVSITARVQSTSLGSASGNIKITGLPFTSTNAQAYKSGARGVVALNLNITAGHTVAVYLGMNTTELRLYVSDATTGDTEMQASEWSDDGHLIFNFSYFV